MQRTEWVIFSPNHTESLVRKMFLLYDDKMSTTINKLVLVNWLNIFIHAKDKLIQSRLHTHFMTNSNANNKTCAISGVCIAECTCYVHEKNRMRNSVLCGQRVAFQDMELIIPLCIGILCNSCYVPFCLTKHVFLQCGHHICKSCFRGAFHCVICKMVPMEILCLDYDTSELYEDDQMYSVPLELCTRGIWLDLNTQEIHAPPFTCSCPRPRLQPYGSNKWKSLISPHTFKS